jgi:glycosyltransferase involved in cell wall biosynthesis
MWETGGIEAWLMNLLRQKRTDVQFDFVVLAKGKLESEAITLGGGIHRIPVHNPAYFRIPQELRTIIAEGNYDVIHSHLYDFSGNIMRLAAEYNVPVRVAHSHTTAAKDRSLLSFTKLVYHRLRTIPLLSKYATNLLACSNDAGNFAFGNRLWMEKRPKKMVYCGIPIEPYNVDFDPNKRLALCEQYGIPNDAIVIGNVGRMCYQKNQEFFIRVFVELAKRDKRYVLFIGGDGELRDSLVRQVEYLSLQDRVFMPGNCNNVPDLICHLFDAFCLPSRYEGFGIVLIEASAGGLHSVCSNILTNEIKSALPESFTELSLSSPLSDWCDAIEAGIQKKKTPREGCEQLRKTLFTIENSMENLLAIYRGEK